MKSDHTGRLCFSFRALPSSHAHATPHPSDRRTQRSGLRGQGVHGRSQLTPIGKHRLRSVHHVQRIKCPHRDVGGEGRERRGAAGTETSWVRWTDLELPGCFAVVLRELAQLVAQGILHTHGAWKRPTTWGMVWRPHSRSPSGEKVVIAFVRTPLHFREIGCTRIVATRSEDTVIAPSRSSSAANRVDAAIRAR